MIYWGTSSAQTGSGNVAKKGTNVFNANFEYRPAQILEPNKTNSGGNKAGICSINGTTRDSDYVICCTGSTGT